MNSTNRQTLSTSENPAGVSGDSPRGAAGGSSSLGFDWNDPIMIGPTEAERRNEIIRALKQKTAARIAEQSKASGIVEACDLLRQRPPPHNPVIFNLFDHGAVVELIGPSKSRKTFLLLMMSLCLASGFDLAGLQLARAFTVLLINPELTPEDFHRRLWRMARQMGIAPETILGRFHVLHLRGQAGGLQEKIESAIRETGSEVLILDSIYALVQGSENDASALIPMAAWFNKLSMERAAVVYSHHDSKGDIAGRDIRDRGSGSNVLARNAYARITLTPHRADPDNAIVLAFMLRGYPPREKMVLRFENDAFVGCDLAPEEQTQQDRRARDGKPSLDKHTKAALEFVAKGPISPKLFKSRVIEELGLSQDRADRFTTILCQEGGPLRRWKEPGFPPRHFIGTKEQEARSSRSSQEDHEDHEDQT